MKTIKYLILSFMLFSMSMLQAHDFEAKSIPPTVTSPDGKSKLAISNEYFKDGKQSLHWSWDKPDAVLKFSDSEIAAIIDSFNRRSGIKFWILNEQPKNKPLTFNFRDANNTIQYTFDFNLNYTGWRAGWIAYSDMWTPDGGQTQKKEITTLEIVSPDDIKSGELWLDRINFVETVDRQATPDAQIPDNNRHLSREIWHWGLLHKWEQLTYDIPIPSSLTAKEEADLTTVYNNIKNQVKGRSLSPAENKELARLIDLFNISDDGKRGAPLLQKDNLEEGDVNFQQLNDIINLSARSWYMDNDKAGRKTFLQAIRYMHTQGFAYESAMGTNHHYGYEIRQMAGAIWWMEDVLKKEKLWEDAKKTITFWSGLQETRNPINDLRDEATDSWNTLIVTRFASAMLGDTKEERFRAMSGLSRWINGSIRYSTGTIGGIKIDGTAFHHGGHYPAYSVPGFASIGQYLRLVNGTQFTLDKRSREVFKFALLSVARQMNLRDWGIGVSGRHPFDAGYGNMSKTGIIAFFYAAQAFDPIDKELAGHYLRLMQGLKEDGTDKKMINFLKEKGITIADDPQGFYVYNNASLGIYRYKDKMISIKGFNANIWGGELYAKDNRYGRYQSYGSVQIIGTKSSTPMEGTYIVSEEASRFTQSGWDWNRNPGTTTIHLPFDKLESPFAGSDMIRQPEKFAGASQLEDGKYGMFAMKLGELNRKNFNPSFIAHKSVFCFDNKIICLGSNISNDNNEFDTETTLFQQNLLSQSEEVELNGVAISQFPYKRILVGDTENPTILKDVTGYYYYLPGNQLVNIEKKKQDSFHNKTKKPTTGEFLTAYINHKKAPKFRTYEYMILIEPSTVQLNNLKEKKAGYEVILNSKKAHIVNDTATKARGYAIFEPFTSESDDYLVKSDAELMIMIRPDGEFLNMSICNPDLNLGEYNYTTSNAGEPIVNKVVIKGTYYLLNSNPNILINHSGENTEITATSRNAMPNLFSLSSKKI